MNNQTEVWTCECGKTFPSAKAVSAHHDNVPMMGHEVATRSVA